MFTKSKNQMLCLKSDRNDKLIMNLDAILFLINLSHYISLNDCSFKLCIDIDLTYYKTLFLNSLNPKLSVSVTINPFQIRTSVW